MRKSATNKRRVSFPAIAVTLFVLGSVASYLACAGWLTGMSRAAYYGYYELRYSGTTEYAPEFHPIEWDRIGIGASIDAVYSQFGAPVSAIEMGELVWFYESPHRRIVFQRDIRDVVFQQSDDTRVIPSDDGSQDLVDLTEHEVVQRLGKPDRVEQIPANTMLLYSTPRMKKIGGGHFVQYALEVDVQNIVVEKHVREIWF